MEERVAIEAVSPRHFFKENRIDLEEISLDILK
jgi:hypothetical protein